MKKTLLSFLAFAVLAGCGSSSNYVNINTNAGTNGNTRTFSTVFAQETPPADVDSVQAVFKDGSGVVVFGPVEVPVDATGFEVTGVPNSAVRVEVDWLRNGGFALFESVHTIGNSAVLAQEV